MYWNRHIRRFDWLISSSVFGENMTKLFNYYFCLQEGKSSREEPSRLHSSLMRVLIGSLERKTSRKRLRVGGFIRRTKGFGRSESLFWMRLSLGGVRFHSRVLVHRNGPLPLRQHGEEGLLPAALLQVRQDDLKD